MRMNKVYLMSLQLVSRLICVYRALAEAADGTFLKLWLSFMHFFKVGDEETRGGSRVQYVASPGW